MHCLILEIEKGILFVGFGFGNCLVG